jgi:hypothetical protein
MIENRAGSTCAGLLLKGARALLMGSLAGCSTITIRPQPDAPVEIVGHLRLESALSVGPLWVVRSDVPINEFECISAHLRADLGNRVKLVREYVGVPARVYGRIVPREWLGDDVVQPEPDPRCQEGYLMLISGIEPLSRR